MKEIITYRLSATGTWGYEFYDAGRNRIGSAGTVVAPSAPVLIRSDGIDWYSRFGVDSTIVPGRGLSLRQTGGAGNRHDKADPGGGLETGIQGSGCRSVFHDEVLRGRERSVHDDGAVVPDAQVLLILLTFLGLIGVIVDPTTAGLGDSERAMGYEVPYQDEN